MNKFCLEGRKNPLIFKKNMAAQLRFATLHLKNPQDSYEGRCLVIMQSFGVVMHSTVFGKKQTQHISTTTSYKLSNTVETWWWSQDPVTLQSLDWPWTPGFKYFRVRCEAVCLRAKATLNLGDETGRWSQASKKISNRMAKKREKNQVFAMAKLPAQQCERLIKW